MTDRLQEVLDDFGAEAVALDALLSTLEGDDWFRATPADGWDIRDTVSHLADTDDLAYDHVCGGPRDLMTEAAEAGSGDAFTLGQVVKGRDRTPTRVLEWWRTSNAQLREALGGHDPGQRILWGPNMITPVSFTTARLMETWAHGLDVFAAMNETPEDTDRLRHVAFLGLRALPYAFSQAGLEGPGPIRLELTSPSGESWEFGPEGAPTVIRGAASDWCRVATQRDRGDERDRLDVTGPDAESILRHVQAYL